MNIKHKIILAVTIVLSTLSITAYIWNFSSLPLSTKSSEWGGFGSYISGTIGIFILSVTLYYLVQATNQQEKLLLQQDMLIKIQYDEMKKNESYRATEIAINHFETINNGFITNHIRKTLNIKLPEEIILSESDSFLAWAQTQDINLSKIMHNHEMYPRESIRDIQWLVDEKVPAEIRANAISCIMEPILKHKDLIAELTEKSKHAENHIQNITRNLDAYFYIAALFFMEYSKNSKTCPLSKKLININNKNLFSIFAITQYKNDVFWRKLGASYADIETK